MKKTIHQQKYKQIVEKLKKARKEASFTQIQVSEKLKKPQSYISKVEAGEQRIDVVELKLFADLYKKPINYFLK